MPSTAARGSGKGRVARRIRIDGRGSRATTAASVGSGRGRLQEHNGRRRIVGKLHQGSIPSRTTAGGSLAALASDKRAIGAGAAVKVENSHDRKYRVGI
jgi:hypothetical protein